MTGSFTQTAVPIEPGALAHWDETRFDTELLTPYAEVSGVATPLSQLTLAALRDLGWNLNFGVAQAYSLPSVAPVVTLAPTAQRSQLAAYTSCGCARCLSASSTVDAIDGKTLTEAIGDRLKLLSGSAKLSEDRTFQTKLPVADFGTGIRTVKRLTTLWLNPIEIRGTVWDGWKSVHSLRQKMFLEYKSKKTGSAEIASFDAAKSSTNLSFLELSKSWNCFQERSVQKSFRRWI